MPASCNLQGGAPTTFITADGDSSDLRSSFTVFMDLKTSCADLSRYVCFVCGCALAARVLAPLRLDEELWWFYVLACGGVLFGPLVGVLPERWHGQATARQLAVARVVYLVLFLQQERPA